MDNKDVDVFIISYNRLSYLKLLIAWLEKAGFDNIHIVDNNSTYPPLLEYLDLSQHKVHRMEKNYGHLVVWECGEFNNIIENKKYIVTDCDVLPISECPLNVVEYFLEVLGKYPKVTKVGFSIKIDDLPENYLSKDSVIEWERQFWINKISDGLYDSPIDTTFALYRQNIYPSNKKWWKSIRTDYPYIARHLPWYSRSDNLCEEDIYYQNSLINKYSFWSITDLKMLQELNSNLEMGLQQIYATRKWKILQLIYKLCTYIFQSNKYSSKIGKKNISSLEKTDNLQILQKYNKQLMIELKTIKSSDGWKFLQNIENFFTQKVCRRLRR